MKNKNDKNRMTAQQLKDSILQMAVQGKLVQQDQNDEPASVLLEKIRTEKAKLVKESKIKKDKNESLIFRGADNTTYEKIGDTVTDISDQIPFDVPEGWEWCRLGNISSYAETKKKINANEAPSDLWGLDLEDIQKGGKLIDKKTVGERKAIGDKTYFCKGDILYSKLRPYLLKILIAKEDGICTPEIVPFHMYGDVNPYYIVYLLKSSYIDTLVNGETYGIKMPRAGTETMVNLFIPLPPISEQHRIVAKIEQLLPYIDHYDETEQKLTTLNAEFPDKLKKSILQIAVQGKLAPQNPTDEPASVLLEKIRAEKENLIKQGKIKRDKNESVIYKRDKEYFEKQNGVEICISDQIPFEIPEGWEWCRLGSVVEINPRNKIDDNVSVSFVPMALIADGYNNLHTSQNKLWKDVKSGFTHFAENDVAFAKITPCFENRKSVIMKNLNNAYGAGTTELHIIRAYNGLIFNKYLLWFCKSAYFIDNGVKAFSGTAGQQRVGKEYVSTCLFPLPSLSEQHRIVAKIDELLSLCNTLT